MPVCDNDNNRDAGMEPHMKAFNQTVMVADIYIQLGVNLRVTSAGYYQSAGNVNGIPVSVKHSIISGPGITRA